MMKKLTDLFKKFRKKEKLKEKVGVREKVSQSDELSQFLVSQEGPSGWTYSKLDKDGLRFRYDHPGIWVMNNQDLHRSLERIRQYGMEGKSCYNCFMNPKGFCGDCYFGYLEAADQDFACSLDNTVELLTKRRPHEEETEAVKFEIAQQYHEQLHIRHSLSMPIYSESLTILKDILYKLWKTGYV